MEKLFAGVDPYESQNNNNSGVGMVVFDGNGRIVSSIHNKQSCASRFRAMSALIYVLYFKRVSLFDEQTKKIVKPKKLMRFVLNLKKSRKK